MAAQQAGGWLLLVCLVEPLAGTLDAGDIVAAIAGFALSVGFLHLYRAIPFAPTAAWRTSSRARLPLALAGIVLLGGSYSYKTEHYDDRYEPVYLSYEELRGAVRVEAPRAMTQMGNLLVYGDRVLINEQGKGLHVIDNTDPATPQAVAFINIPGNTNASVRDGYIYADSFVDLVVLGLAESGELEEKARVQDIFDYPSYEAELPYGYVDWGTSDPAEAGIVIGFQRVER